MRTHLSPSLEYFQLYTANYIDGEGEIYSTSPVRLCDLAPLLNLIIRTSIEKKKFRLHIRNLKHVCSSQQLSGNRSYDQKHKKFKSYVEFTLVWCVHGVFQCFIYFSLVCVWRMLVFYLLQFVVCMAYSSVLFTLVWCVYGVFQCFIYFSYGVCTVYGVCQCFIYFSFACVWRILVFYLLQFGVCMTYSSVLFTLVWRVYGVCQCFIYFSLACV